MDNQIDNPFNESIDKLKKAIDEFKSIHPGYIYPEYERQFIGNFKLYLKSLDQIDKETSLKYISLGIEFSKALSDSLEDGESTSLTFSIYRKVAEELQVEEIEETVIRTAINTKEPAKFSHNPGVDAIQTKRAQNDWYEFVQLNKHQIAKEYVKRTSRKFTRDEVLLYYHQERKKDLKVEESFRNTISWIKSYKSIDEVYDDIGIQLFDESSFNKEYNRWKKKLGTELS